MALKHDQCIVLEFDFINSLIYFHTLDGIMNSSSAICMHIPFMCDPLKIFQKLVAFQILYETKSRMQCIKSYN